MIYIFWTSVFLVIYSYLFYPLLLKAICLFKNDLRRIDNNIRPTISMLVAAYNEEENIEKKIANFLALDYPVEKMEMIIGSDGSSDRTDEILGSVTNSNIKIFLYKTRSGKAAVLNRLAKKATGQILVFSDANTIYDGDALLNLVRHFAELKVGGVCGKLILKNPNANVGGDGEQIYWGYENNLKKLEGKIKTVLGANGAIYALVAKLYRDLPEKKVVMDDFLIPLYAVMAGYDIIYDEEAIATETTSPHLKGEFSRKVRIGAANFNALVEIKSLMHPRMGFVAFALWSHKIFRWFAPFMLLTIFVTNLFLLTSIVYQLTIILQFGFYFLAIVGHFLNKKNKLAKIFMYPLYFTAVNGALFLGFFKFITKSQRPAWTRIERS